MFCVFFQIKMFPGLMSSDNGDGDRHVFDNKLLCCNVCRLGWNKAPRGEGDIQNMADPNIIFELGFELSGSELPINQLPNTLSTLLRVRYLARNN